jgi:hypothetical protein
MADGGTAAAEHQRSVALLTHLSTELNRQLPSADIEGYVHALRTHGYDRPADFDGIPINELRARPFSFKAGHLKALEQSRAPPAPPAAVPLCGEGLRAANGELATFNPKTKTNVCRHHHRRWSRCRPCKLAKCKECRAVYNRCKLCAYAGGVWRPCKLHKRLHQTCGKCFALLSAPSKAVGTKANPARARAGAGYLQQFCVEKKHRVWVSTACPDCRRAVKQGIGRICPTHAAECAKCTHCLYEA